MIDTPQIAFVTGSNKSIGFETVRGLAAVGMTVYLGSRDLEAGQAAARGLSELGDVRAVQLDVLNEDSMAHAIGLIAEEQGRLDVLINNAGVAPSSGGAAQSSWEDIDLTMRTNVHGPARLIQMALPLLRKSGAARIVNVTSSAGSFHDLTDPKGALALAPFKPYAYCLSKSAANAMTVLFADDLKSDGIKVNSVCPGLVKSQVSRFMGTRGPEQGARIVIKLATQIEDSPTGGFFDESGRKSW
jgi:NAD(P)-dependent dehydrogenase (short-subunit alcohol dehydrogenase family)